MRVCACVRVFACVALGSVDRQAALQPHPEAQQGQPSEGQPTHQRQAVLWQGRGPLLQRLL